MYLHTPAVEAGSWWRVDTASGSDTGTTVYAHDGTDAIPNYYVLPGSTVRNTTRDGTAQFWSGTQTLYLKELTYQGAPNGTVVTSTGVTPAAPVGGAPVDIATISTAVAALPTTYVKLLVTDATSAVLTGTLVAGHLSPVDCTVGPGVRTLPAANSVAIGTPTVAKKADTTTNTLTVQRAGSDLIFGTGAGSTSKTLTLSGEAVTFVSNGVDRWSVESSDTPSSAIAAGYAPIAATPVASSATSGTLTAGAEHNLSPSSAAAWTLPTSVTATKLPTTVKNNGTAAVTVARGGSDTINGGTTSVSIAATEWARFTSDGAGAWTQSGTAGQTGTYAPIGETFDRFYTPSAQLTFTSVGAAYVPTAIGTDGLAYGVQSDGAKVLVRSSDGFASVDTGADLALVSAPDPVIYVNRIAEGYIAVTANNANTGTGTRAALWFSTSWASGWTKKQDLSTGVGTARIAIGRPEYDAVTAHTMWAVGEYTQQVGVNHHLWVTRDGGQTWIDSFNRVAVDATNNNHMHAWAFDPSIRRMWLSHGDGKNAYFAYSDDLGSTWTAIPAHGMPVVTTSPATIYHQPPILIAGEKFLITCPDGGDTGLNQSAVWAVDKSPAGAVTEAFRVANVDGAKQYSSGPYAMSSDRRRIYMVFPQSPSIGTTNQVYVAASGDGGRSWASVYTAASVLGDDYLTGIVGPDAAGRLFLCPLPNGGGARTLLRATEPTWSPVYTGQRATGISDLKAAMVQAGLVAGGGASPLDLEGGRLKAGNLTLNATNAQITMGDGTNVAVIDTATGTGQVRFRTAGTEVVRYDSGTFYILATKQIKWGTSGTVIMGSSTGSPEGVVAGGIGSVFHRSDGGATTSLYVKESGSSTTGWRGTQTVAATGTATLAGGTATVSDASITANSIIRLASKTLGGTPGAVYVSAKTASTSFVITSTSGTDTSVIQYYIDQY